MVYVLLNNERCDFIKRNSHYLNNAYITETSNAMNFIVLSVLLLR